MSSTLSRVIDILSDGRWHKLETIQRKLELKEGQTEQIVAFLEECAFIVKDKTKREIKLDSNFMEFLTKTSNA